MELGAGSKLGPYEILAPLGAGGMGEVYRARDTRLERTVAIKVLPAHLSSSADLKQRFEREARAISSLNHPHICTVYDVGSQDGIDFLVMEYLEGETLAERLKKKPLPLDQVLKTGIEIADALDKAHRAGFVHRDLKPGNIMLTKRCAKLMDFGLAKPAAMTATTGGGTAPQLSAATTMSFPRPSPSPLTSAGEIVGTIQYMSPEQIEGREADARSDIFALGAVLYEMATGRRAFEGKSQITVASAILEKNPEPISATQPASPAALDAIVRICLAKDPEDRFASAHDVKLQLKLLATSAAPSEASASSRAYRLRDGVLLAAAVVAVLVSGRLGYDRWRQAHGDRLVVRSILDLPESSLSGVPGYGARSTTVSSLALSPDGQYLAFSGKGSASVTQIWLRPLRANSAQALAGTENGDSPFWSPDGRWLAFFADGQLKKIALASGVVSTVCAAPFHNGAWGADDTIVISGGPSSALNRVAASGGEPKAINGTLNGLRPFLLPDGKHFLYIEWGNANGEGNVKVASVQGGTPVDLGVRSASRALYASGYLLYAISTHIVAQRFDPDRMRLLGEPQVLVEGGQGYFALQAPFTVSQNGLFAYRPAGGSGREEIQLVSRDGRVEPSGIAAGFNNNPRFSPDGKRVVYDLINGVSRDIWVFDLQRRVNTRFTLGGATFSDPMWSPDGKQVVFTAWLPESCRIVVKATAGGSEETLMQMPGMVWPRSWSLDGRFLFVDFYRRTSNGDTHRRIEALALSDGKPIALAPEDKFDRRMPSISPNGRWLAYVSNESGREEVYLQTFPANGNRMQVSSGGGAMPRWRGDGRELYFITGSLKAAAVEISYKGDSVQVGALHELFPINPLYPGGNPLDVSRDGKLFVVNSVHESGAAPITLISNWDAALQK